MSELEKKMDRLIEIMEVVEINTTPTSVNITYSGGDELKPKAPTHEEEAEYFMCGIGTSEIYDKTIEEIISMGFIAGRKSMELK